MSAKLKSGDTVRLTQYARDCGVHYRNQNRHGVVVSVGKWVYVRWEGNKTTSGSYYPDFIERVDQLPPESEPLPPDVAK